MDEANHVPLSGTLHKETSEAVTAAAAEFCRPITVGSGLDVKQVNCECCGLCEDCTVGYIARVKELFCGHWVCGLCTEAVNEERYRMGCGTPMEDALRSHMTICVEFNLLTRSNPAINLADALKELLRRNLEGQPARNSPKIRSLTRSSSCASAISRPFS